MPTIETPSAPFSDPSTRPIRNPYILCNEVQEEAVLYDPLREYVYALNHSAYLIWLRCDGTATIDDMATEFAGALDIQQEQLVEQITSIVDNLNRLDLLSINPSDNTHSSRHVIRIQHNEYQVHIHTDSEEILQNIAKRFEAMISDEEATNLAGQLGVYKTNKGYSVTGTRVVHVADGTMPEAIRALKHETVLRFIESQPDYIWLHAGAVSRGKGALVFAGPWGAGKSTLVSALYGLGWLYLSDDVIPLNTNTLHAEPFPLTPAMRHNPDQDARLHVAQLPKRLTLLEPNTICTTPQPVRAIIFPRYKKGGSNTLEPCSPGTVASKLVKFCQNIESHKEQGVKTLCTLASRIPGYILHYNDGPEAVEIIQNWYATIDS